MINESLRSTEYFNSLPPFVQESIMQSGIEFDNEESMRGFVAQLNGGNE